MTICEKKEVKELLAIEAAFDNPITPTAKLSPFLTNVKEALFLIFPKKRLSAETSFEKLFADFEKSIPFIQGSFQPNNPLVFTLTTISFGEYTHGLGRFIPDMLSRWLIPGKQMAIPANSSILFRFCRLPQKTFYFAQFFVTLADKKEKDLIEKYLSSFIQELKLNILAVYHARHLISIRNLSLEQKSAMIEENITSLLHRKESAKEQSAFDTMHEFLIKISEEKKLSEIHENIKHLLYTRPKIFDRDIFDEMHLLSKQFQSHFTAIRDPLHVSRIISFQYLFKKTVKKALKSFPLERHISTKVLKTHLTTQKTVLGILISVNFIRETERLDKQQLLKSIRELLSHVQYVPDSYIQDRSDESIASLYFEIEKQDNSSFLMEEIELLRRTLPLMLKTHIESVVTPIFMPRNEEEIFRNIIFLSNQLKYVKDIPQVIISFDKQTGKQIAFTIILVRVLKPLSFSISDLFSKTQTQLKFIPEEVKQVGFIKRKYPKEANLFRVYMKKGSFFRKDNSLDLQKARKTLVSELAKVVGEFRDNNGGLIQKQSQAFDILKEKLGKRGQDQEFLLENLFYSLKPVIMQSILDVTLLSEFFDLFLEIYQEDYLSKPFHIVSKTLGNYFLVMIGSLSLHYKEALFSTLSHFEIPSLELTESSLEFSNVSTLGYILKSKDLSQRTHFYSSLLEGLKRWEQKAERVRLLEL